MPNPVVCPECGEAVPAGRLACSSCGALLASVVRVQGPATRGPVAEQRAQGAVTIAPEDASTLMEEIEEAEVDPAFGEPEPEGPVSRPVAEVSAAQAARTREPSPIDAILRDAGEDDEPDSHGAPARSTGGYIAPAPAALTPVAVAAPAAMAAAVPAPSWPGAGANAAVASAPVAGSAGRRLPIALPDMRAGWLTTVGAALGLLAFLLPWPGNGDQVIGTSGGTGWFDRWGLAATPNLVFILAELTVLALAFLAIGVPAWIQFGVLPLVVGGILLGVAWIYLTRPFGADIGIVVLGLGASLQVAGGVWALRRTEARSIV